MHIARQRRFDVVTPGFCGGAKTAVLERFGMPGRTIGGMPKRSTRMAG